jgi:oligoribonuclease
MTTIASPILWVDLETTGSDPESDDVIEIGMLLTSGPDLEHVDGLAEVFKTRKSISSIDPVVFRMHSVNGLWIDCITEAKRFAPEAQQTILSWLGSHGALTKPHSLPIAGSGVAHFDRRFIARDWPALDKYLTYWSYDIGSMRRFLRMWGMLPAGGPDVKSHRAPDDIAGHVQEALHMREIVQR